MGKRRRAREMVLQALYETEFSDRSAGQVVEEQIDRRGPSEEGAERARDLFLKTVEMRDELDRIIRQYLENWDFERLSLIDRNILRFALAEVLYFPDVPSNVIIDEAIEIAHRYSSEEAGRLVNGLVDRAVKEFRGGKGRVRFAVFSDVHGNLEALEAVLAHAEKQRAAFYLCLGDVIGYGANPNECVDRVRALSPGLCLRGNHDAAAVDARERAFFHEVALQGIHFSARHLSPENAEYLHTLPYVYREHARMMAVHASPYHPELWEYVLDSPGAERAFEAMTPARVAFIGHSHSPVVFCDDGSVQRFPSQEVLVMNLDTRRYVMNVGSVGQPRDGNPDASYVVYDDDEDSVTHHRVRYDREKAAEKILRAGLPPVLAERLLIGY